MSHSLKSIATALLAASSLALTACGSEAEGEAALDGDPIEAIAAPEGQSWLDTTTVSESDGYVLGNPDAPIKLVEYASHTCGGCAAFAQQAVEPLKEKYISTGIVSFELRNLVRDPIDLAIATMVRCGADTAMQPLSDQAWNSFDEVVPPAYQWLQTAEGLEGLETGERMVKIAEGAGLIDFFAARGLSADQAKTCLADGDAVEALAKRSTDQAKELGINSTPTFLLNGQNISNQSWATLEPMLQRAGAR
jgi:protein-disulfide isomerase